MGKTIEQIAKDRGHEIVIRKDLEPLEADLSLADVAIDFSHPNAAFDNICACIDAGVPVVSGTTGWLDKKAQAEAYCEQKGGAFLYASNFSIGVNVFFNLNAYLARLMSKIEGYEVSMEEIHHVHKLDAPSGTAISLAEGLLEHSPKESWSTDREGEKELLIKVKREGETPGTHIVQYNSGVDRIEIMHKAHNRTGFALGAVVAAEWIQGRKGVFSMQDVLQLSGQ